MDLDAAVVVNEAQFSKFVHEETHARPGAAEPERRQTLGSAMECYLSELFRDHDGSPPPGLYHRTLREIEYPLISASLAATGGNQIKAAELLGLNRNTLRKKVRNLDIKVDAFATLTRPTSLR